MRSGGRRLGGLWGTAACWPQRRVIPRGPWPWHDYAGQLGRRRGERGGEGAPGAYHKSSRSDGWGGGGAEVAWPRARAVGGAPPRSPGRHPAASELPGWHNASTD
jgi:hypothetical protein